RCCSVTGIASSGLPRIIRCARSCGLSTWRWRPCRRNSRGCTPRFVRPPIPPERLLRALLLQAFYSVRSERQLMEQLEYNLLFRWFVGLSLDDEIWVESVFTKNRERLIEGDIGTTFMAAVLDREAVK